MENHNNSHNSVMDMLSSKKGIAVAVLMFVLGLLLIYFQNSSQFIVNNKETIYDIAKYTEQCENKLENIANSICGTANSKAMVTLESSFESVFATNAVVDKVGEYSGDTLSNTKKELVLKRNQDNSDEPVEIKRIMPKIKGVVIVCNCENNEIVRQNIKNAVMCAFDISQDKICVVAGN